MPGRSLPAAGFRNSSLRKRQQEKGLLPEGFSQIIAFRKGPLHLPGTKRYSVLLISTIWKASIMSPSLMSL